MSNQLCWVTYGKRQGWMHAGTVPARQLLGGDFWSAAVRVACAAEGGTADAVQCYDLGIMTAGPLGFTAASGTLPKLLAALPPQLAEACLSDLFVDRNMGLSSDGRLTRGLRQLTENELREVFLGGSDGVVWTERQKEVAQAWVERLQELLSSPACLRPMTLAASKILMGYLLPEAASMLAATGGNVSSLPVLRRATACFLAYSINHPKGALKLLRATGTDADRMMEAARMPGAWPSTFAGRTDRVKAAIAAETW